MQTNPVLETMMKRKSVRAYTDVEPTDDVIETIVRAGQQAPFAAQLCSLLLRRDRPANPFHAPLLFTVCVDLHRMEHVMALRGWTSKMSDLSSLLLGIQDAAYVAENLVIAGESVGLGSCFLGATPYYAERLAKSYHLPKRVFPLVQLAMGYPADDAPPRPRYPIEFTLFEDRYPEFDAKGIEQAARVMDEGYLSQDYYRRLNARIPLENGADDPVSDEEYSWTEHISRKLGQWGADPAPLLAQLEACGFHLTEPRQ